MKYILVTVDKDKYWFELEEDNFVNRQIVLDEYNKFHISCMEDCLTEGAINEADLEGEIFYLTKRDFESVWQSVLNKYEKYWEQIKKKYPIGVYVQGINSYSYPQGTVIIGKDFIAIYNGNESFCINKTVEYKVKSYDDINMWLVVE